MDNLKFIYAESMGNDELTIKTRVLNNFDYNYPIIFSWTEISLLWDKFWNLQASLHEGQQLNTHNFRSMCCFILKQFIRSGLHLRVSTEHHKMQFLVTQSNISVFMGSICWPTQRFIKEQKRSSDHFWFCSKPFLLWVCNAQEGNVWKRHQTATPNLILL